MNESATYQAILAEGRAEGRAEGQAEGRTEGERDALIRFGTRQFGPPDARVLASLQSISDVDRLGALAERLLDVSGWDELLKEGD
jgi:predicted transposase YdaD